MTKPRTYRLSADMDQRLKELADRNGGLSMQAIVTMVLARGLAAYDDDQATPRKNGGKF
jgi:hypothetical protein